MRLSYRCTEVTAIIFESLDRVVIALVGGLGLAFLVDALDNTVKSRSSWKGMD